MSHVDKPRPLISCDNCGEWETPDGVALTTGVPVSIREFRAELAREGWVSRSRSPYPGQYLFIDLCPECAEEGIA